MEQIKNELQDTINQLVNTKKRKERLGGRVGKGRKIDHVQRVEARDAKGEVVKDSLGRIVYKTIFHYSDKM